jgi:hypothetical protein
MSCFSVCVHASNTLAATSPVKPNAPARARDEVGAVVAKRQYSRERVLFFIIGLFCVFIGVGCKTDQERCVSSGGKVLSAAEALKIYRGNTLTGEIPSQALQFQIHYAEEGQMVGRVTYAGSTDTDRGSYLISASGMLCARWIKWQVFNGCIPVYREGPILKMFTQPSGELLATQKMLKGDPLKLMSMPFAPSQAMAPAVAPAQVPAPAPAKP